VTISVYHHSFVYSWSLYKFLIDYYYMSSSLSSYVLLLWGSSCLLLLLPIDGNDDDDALIATAAASITLFINSDYNSTLDGNPIPSS
jgi:hypothetical protein